MMGPLNRNQTPGRAGRSSLFSAIGCILSYDGRYCCGGLWHYSLLGSWKTFKEKYKLMTLVRFNSLALSISASMYAKALLYPSQGLIQ
jgi:hypothetical protein